MALRVRAAVLVVLLVALFGFAVPSEARAEEDVGLISQEYQLDDALIWDEGDRVVFTDMDERPLSGSWRIQGVHYLLANDGSIVAGGGALGSKGRLYVPAGSIDVAVNSAVDENAQDYTDQEDSAAYVRYCLSKYYIADHSNQAYAGLTDVTVGDEAYLVTEEGIESFVCSETLYGHNIENGLTDSDGKDLGDRFPLNGFVAYTCLDNWRNVYVTFWKRTWIASARASGAVVHLAQHDAQTVPMENVNSPSERRDIQPIRTCSVPARRTTSLFASPVLSQTTRVFPGLQLRDAARLGSQISLDALDPLQLLPDVKQFRARMLAGQHEIS